MENQAFEEQPELKFENVIKTINESQVIFEDDKKKAERIIRRLAEDGKISPSADKLHKMFVWANQEGGHEFWYTIDHKIEHPEYWKKGGKDEATA